MIETTSGDDVELVYPNHLQILDMVMDCQISYCYNTGDRVMSYCNHPVSIHHQNISSDFMGIPLYQVVVRHGELGEAVFIKRHDGRLSDIESELYDWIDSVHKYECID